MKIVHVIDSGGFYGKERVVVELMNQQLAHGHTVKLINLGHNHGDFVTQIPNGLQLVTIHCKRGIKHKDVITLRDTVLQGEDPDIVHAHGQKESLMLLLARWSMRFLLVNRKRFTIVRSVHGYTSTSIFSRNGLKTALDKFLFCFHDKVVGVSENMVEDFGIEVVNNGITMVDYHHERVDPHIKMFCNDAPFVLLCTARLSAEKNLYNLILAMKSLPGAKLMIIGDGPLRDDLGCFIAQNNISERVLMTGFIGNAADYLSLADAYIQPSLTEGLPISILEAMSVGKNIVMTRVGGMESLLKLGIGWGCGTDDMSIADVLSSLTNAMVLKEASGRISRFDSYAQEIFKEQFSSLAMYNGYDRVYNKLNNKE